jgi:hypothetical protein
MDSRKGYYALIQYCPDPSRLESVNVGALLFCPGAGFLKARFARGHDRVKRLFGPQEWSFLDAQIQAIDERLLADGGLFRTVGDLQAFIDRRMHDLRMTPLRPMKVFDAEKDLEDLFRKLVGERAEHEPTTRARTLFDRELTRSELRHLMQTQVEVQVPSIKRTVRVPYGYRNNRFNMIAPMGFTSVDVDKAFMNVSPRAIEAEALYKTRDPERGQLQLIVVGHFGAGAEAHMGMVRDILTAHKARFFPLSEVTPLLEDIRRHAPKESGKESG